MQAATLTAPITRAMRRVKGVANGAKLKAALAEVSRLERARQEIQREIDARIDTSEWDANAARLKGELEASTDFRDKILRELLPLATERVHNRVMPLRVDRLRHGSDGGA